MNRKIDTNRRKLKRYLKNDLLEIKWSLMGVDQDGVAVNLNQKGVDICCIAPPQIGSEILIDFRFEDEGRGAVFESVPGKVKWTRKLGLFHSGVEFLKELNQEKHFMILSQIEKSKRSED